MSMMSTSKSNGKPTRQPIHYRFISIDEECSPSPPSSSSSTPSPSSESPTSPTPAPSAPACFALLHQFYDELMIPTFPLEEERDDIEDWLECFRMQRKLRHHRLELQERKEIKDALTDVLGEEGIAFKVQQFTNNCDDDGFGDGDGEEEESCEFEGPAMDVILMVRDGKPLDANNEEDDDGHYFTKRRRESLLRSQSSLYGGLYTPPISEDEASESGDLDDGGSNRDGTMGDGIAAAVDDDAPKQPKSSRRLLRKQSSLYAGLYAPTTIKEEQDDELEAEVIQEEESHVIIGGVAVEYYKQSRVGLLSYVVLHSEYRGCGLAKYLHKEALSRLEKLSKCYGTPPLGEELPLTVSSTTIRQQRQSSSSVDSLLLDYNNTNNTTDNNNNKPLPLLRAIFAESNTPKAGDVTPEQSLSRHKSLYNLGYRLVKFPYAQPPLSTEDVNGSFDDIVLLVYFPFESSDDLLFELEGAGPSTNGNGNESRELARRYCPWFLEKQSCGNRSNDDIIRGGGFKNSVELNADIPFRYVEDFYQSVFGYECEGIPDYHAADYYKLAHWFTNHRQTTSGPTTKGVKVSLCRPASPWEDCKDELMVEWKESQERIDQT